MLQRITLAVEAIRDMNRQIATAAEEQTSVAEDISRNLIEIPVLPRPTRSGAAYRAGRGSAAWFVRAVGRSHLPAT
jgi:methyl-accepting chemotaxis protein